IDYVNVARSSETQSQISTNIIGVGAAAGGNAGGGGAGGRNSSAASLSQTSSNNFWQTLNANLLALMSSAAAGEAVTDSVISNPETGVISVRATARQHDAIASFLNDVQSRSLHQVLIEATVVEVRLDDDYQAGVDWNLIDRNNGEINFVQSVTSSDLTNAPTSILTIDRSNTPDAISATVAMLSQFGESRVLSSPKIMTLNNQSAMLRVV